METILSFRIFLKAYIAVFVVFSLVKINLVFWGKKLAHRCSIILQNK